MKTTRYLSLSLFLLLLAGTFTACDSTEPEDGGAGEEELITRIVLTLTGGGNTVTATANDPDGDGVDIQTETLTLTSGVTYTGTIDLFNDTADEPGEMDIGAEVSEERDEHQLFYTYEATQGGADRVEVTVTDQDSNGLPVGLTFQVTVTGGDAAAGTLNVVLSHYDDQPKDGTTRSDETDVDVTFPVVIQ